MDYANIITTIVGFVLGILATRYNYNLEVQKKSKELYDPKCIEILEELTKKFKETKKEFTIYFDSKHGQQLLLNTDNSCDKYNQYYVSVSHYPDTSIHLKAICFYRGILLLLQLAHCTKQQDYIDKTQNRQKEIFYASILKLETRIHRQFRKFIGRGDNIITILKEELTLTQLYKNFDDWKFDRKIEKIIKSHNSKVIKKEDKSSNPD